MMTANSLIQISRRRIEELDCEVWLCPTYTPGISATDDHILGVFNYSSVRKFLRYPKHEKITCDNFLTCRSMNSQIGGTPKLMSR